MGVALVQLGAHLLVRRHQPARQHQQIVELELAVELAKLHRPEREVAQHGTECEAAFVVDVAHRGLGGVGRGGDRCLERRQHIVGSVMLLPVGSVAHRFRLGDNAQQAEQLAERQRPGQVLGTFGELAAHLLLRVTGRWLERGCGSTQTGEPALDRHLVDLRGWLGRDALGHEIPVGLEVLRHPTDAFLDAEVVVLAQLDQAHRRRIVEQGLEEVGEAFVERRRALHLVENTELRWQLCLHGELVEQAAGERVQRADGGQIELGESGCGERRVASCRGGSTLQRAADLVAQIGGGLLGEGDRRDPADRDAAADQVHHPPHECGRLAAAGTGFHEQGGAEGAGDQVAIGLVGCRSHFRAGDRCRRRRRRRPGCQRRGRVRRAEQVELVSHRCAPWRPTSRSTNPLTCRCRWCRRR